MSIQYNRILKRVIVEEKFMSGLSSLLSTEFKQDWIGRIYAVINPFIKDGKYDPTSNIQELGSDDASYAYVENVIMGNLSIIDKYIRTNNLFDMLTFELKRLDEYHNYLFMLYPVPYIALFKYAKRFALLMTGLLIIGALLLIFL